MNVGPPEIAAQRIDRWIQSIPVNITAIKELNHRANLIKVSSRIWKSALALLVVLVLVAKLPGYILGDHKITEGMNLRDKDAPRYSITYDSKQNLIYLSGTLDIGVAAELKKLLDSHPQSVGLVLDSGGGNIYQARGIANLIMQNELDTYLFNHCYSACTIAFLAGINRYATIQAELGFHGYNLESTTPNSFISIEQEQSKDLDFFAKQISDKNFVQKFFSTNQIRYGFQNLRIY